jgi:outer membrane protein assembly factor BamA
LVGNSFKYEGKKAHSSEVVDYVRQKPNPKMFAIIPFALWMYNQSDKELDESFDEYDLIVPSERSKKKLDSILIKNGLVHKAGKYYWWQRQMHKLGSPPVIIDSSLVSNSTERLRRFYQSKGYFDAKTSFIIKDKGKKKGKVQYKITPNQVTTISSYQQDIPYIELLELYEKYKNKEYIKVGNPLDQTQLKNEIVRLENIFKNQGYWNINNTKEIFFETDTIGKNKNVPLTLKIQKDTLANKNKNFKKYYYDKITFHDYKKGEEIIETEYKNYIIKTSKNRKFYLGTYENMAIIEKNKKYSLKDELKTKRRIYATNNFDILDYRIDTTQVDSLLNVDIQLLQKRKYDLDFSTDSQYSELLNFGFSPGVNFKMRNIFKGAENLDISLQGTFGTVHLENTSNNLFNASDISLQAKITYPKLFIFPFADRLINKNLSPFSSLNVGINRQHNIGLGRINFASGLNYYIQPNEMTKHQLNWFNTQYTNITQPENYFNVFSNARNVRDQMFNIYFEARPELSQMYNSGLISSENLYYQMIDDDAFYSKLDEKEKSVSNSFFNLVYKNFINTTSSLNNSIIYEFDYDQRLNPLINNPLFFHITAEYSGLLLNALDNIFKLEGKVLDVIYTNFFKVNLDFRQYWRINPKNEIAFRQFFGVAIPFKDSFIPFDKNYFMGGSNDLRAWLPFSLGPASTNFGDFSVDSFKILSSLEYRFPIASSLYGATFVDVGNIWSSNNFGAKKDNENPFDTTFDFSNFYNELGVGSGLGFRYDIKYLKIRFDFAYKVADPSLPLGERFSFKNIQPLKPTINFAINYPF